MGEVSYVVYLDVGDGWSDMLGIRDLDFNWAAFKFEN